MSFTAEGTLDIDLSDFWGWVHTNYTPCKSAEVQYSVPRRSFESDDYITDAIELEGMSDEELLEAFETCIAFQG